MSLANPLIIKIDGTDYGPAGLKAVQQVSGDCTGVDRVGTANIILVFEASAGYTFIPTREVQIYIETYTGSTHTGNHPLFGGFIMHQEISVEAGPSQVTTVTLQCQDYNCLLDYIIPDLDVSLDGHFTLGADVFDAQVEDLLNRFQLNNAIDVSRTTVSKPIITADVQNISGTHVYGNLNVATGISLRQGLRILMQRAVIFDGTLRPRFFLELVTDPGAPTTVKCGLVVYDAGAGLPSAGQTFAEIPGGGEFGIVSVQPHRRTFDSALPQANYIQTVREFGTNPVWTKVYTSEGATSEATYFNPYINGGLTGHVGPWKLPIVKDTQSADDDEGQAFADMNLFAKQYPRETFQFEEDGEFVQPQSVVHVRTTNIDQDYEVTAVAFSFPSITHQTAVRYTVSCGLPLLELFDNSDLDYTIAPDLFDEVPPLPPGLPVENSETYDWISQGVFMNFTIPPSPSPDAFLYQAYYTDGLAGTTIWEDIADITNWTPDHEFFPNSPCTLIVHCRDRAGNWSDWSAEYDWTTIDTPALLAAPGSLTETLNAYDPPRELTRIDWSWTAPADPDGLGIVGYQVTFAQGSLGQSVRLGVVLTWTTFALPGQAYTMTVRAIDGHERLGLTATITGTAALRIWPVLFNPSFENVEDIITPLMPRGWFGANGNGTVFWDNSTATDGAYSLKFTYAAGAVTPSALSDMFQIQEHAAYIMTLDAKGSSAVGAAHVLVKYYDASLSLLSSNSYASPGTLTTSWATYRIPILAAPATGARYCTVKISPGASPNDTWIDNLHFSAKLPTDDLSDNSNTFEYSALFDGQGSPLAVALTPAEQVPVDGTITDAHLYTDHGDNLAATVEVWYNATQWPTSSDLILTENLSGDELDDTGLSIAVAGGGWIRSKLTSIITTSSTNNQLTLGLVLVKS